MSIRAWKPGTPMTVRETPSPPGWKDAYQQGLPLGPPPGPVLAGGPLPSGQDFRQSYQVPIGSYYVVIDNTGAAGTVAPPIQPLNPLADPVATLSYVAQLAED